jgi:hypothetical protein
MPTFRTTKNVFVDFNEWYDPNWMDNDRIILPNTQEWSYDREMQIEDVDLWEVVTEFSGGGVYASWRPYAEFYMVKLPVWAGGVQTFYGKGCDAQVKAYLKEKNIPWRPQQPHPYYSSIQITREGMKYLPVEDFFPPGYERKTK